MLLFIGAGDEIRTRDQELGKLLLYQLSYARLIPQPLCFPIDTITDDPPEVRNTVYHVPLCLRESTSVQEHQIETEMERQNEVN